MRLTEEKTVIKLQILFLILLFVSTTLVQIADCKIANCKDTIVTEILVPLKTHHFCTDHKLNANFYTLYEALNIDVAAIDKDLFSSPYVDQQSEDLASELKEDLISSKKFLEKQIAYEKPKRRPT